MLVFPKDSLEVNVVVVDSEVFLRDDASHAVGALITIDIGLADFVLPLEVRTETGV